MDGWPFTLLLIAAGVFAGYWVVHGVWRAVAEVRIRRKGRRRLRSARAVLWRDPGPVRALDLDDGPGGPEGAPVPPYRFLEEHDSGSSPCVSVRDGRGRRWRVKWGDEVQSEVAASRLAWAAGYFVETCYYVPEGRLEGVTELRRARACVDDACAFRHARFELDEEHVVKHFEEHSWAWDANPFVGTRELGGLKIVLMLVSNWDNKDRRDLARGSNTAIFEHPVPGGGYEARYLIIDWGGSLGRWGSVLGRGKWDAAGFRDQSGDFVRLERGGLVWGFNGQRTPDAVDDVTLDDVRWIVARFEGLQDTQIADAFAAAGATPAETITFTAAVRARLDQLASTVEAAGVPVSA